MEEDHVFMETEVEVRCQDEIFKAKGKVIKQIGWKLYEECFKNEDGLAIENPADAGKDRIPKVEVNHKVLQRIRSKDGTFYSTTETV